MIRTSQSSEKIGVYADEMFSATDLNRRAGEVLNQARKHPVTISRNNEQFALLPREQVGKLVEAVTVLSNSVQVLGAALAASNGGDVPVAFSWLSAFDADELSTFARELLSALTIAATTEDWDVVRDLVTQWERSAIVLTDQTMDAAFAADSDEVPLPDPASVRAREPVKG